MAISINDFQRISNGTFNAGDITLTSSGKLDKVNNHVGILKAFNKTPIDVQTTLRVKNEFVNALRQSGVSDADIAAVRQELGLGDADGRGFSLKDLKPLTRAQTREILDRFSKTINEQAGSNIIKNRWAGNEARQTSNAELGRRIAAATEERLAGINKGIGVTMRNGELGSLPSNLKRELNALNLSAGTVKTFAAIAGQMLVNSSADVGDIAAAALKKTLLAELGGKLGSDEARNMLKSIAEASTGSLTAIGQRLTKAADALMNGSVGDIDGEVAVTEKFTAKDLHPVEMRKLKVLDVIDGMLEADGKDKLDEDERAEVLDFMSEWGDIENGECPNLEANIHQSTVDYVKESMDGNGVLKYNEEGFCDQFIGDAHRSVCTIGGKTTDVQNLSVKESDKVTCDALKKMFPDATDRKMVTSLMNQSAINCFYHMQVGSPGDRAEEGDPPLYKLDLAGSKITRYGADMDAEDTRPIYVQQPQDGGLKYSVDFDPKTNTATVRSGINYRIAPSRSIPAIYGLNSESNRPTFGSVYCECTFTVTGIGTGNPQLSATQISQTFNMD